MSDAPSIIVASIATMGSIAVAAVQRASVVGAEKLKERVDALEAKLKGLEGLPREWAEAKTFINEQLAAAKRSIEGRVGDALRRQATGSHPVLPSQDDLRRWSGVDELARRVSELEAKREEDREGKVELQVQLARLDERLVMLSGGGGKR